MSRGCARTALTKRVQAVLEHWQLPYKGGEDDIRTPAIFEQFVKVENDDLPDAPGVVVQIGEVTQTGEVRTGVVNIIALVYAKDSEQGIRDAENLIEDIETDLVTNPWLDNGAYKLTGPWKTTLSGNDYPVFSAVLTCGLELPAVMTTVGPGGVPLDIG